MNIDIQFSGESLRRFASEVKAKYEKVVTDRLKSISDDSILSLTRTSKHKDWTGRGRRSYRSKLAKNELVISNVAENNGFYYMPHIDRGGKSGRGGFIRPRQFSKEAVDFVKSKNQGIFKK